MAVLTESNHNAHTTITSYTPPTTPSHTSITKVTNHTTKENAIEILDSEDETTDENIGDARLVADSNAASHDSHMIGRGHSLSPASKYIPGESLVSASGAHRPCVSEARPHGVNSLLGKRKSYDRYPEQERDDPGQGRSHDFVDGAPVKSLCTSDSRETNGMSPSCVTMDTNSRGDERGCAADGECVEIEGSGTSSGLCVKGIGIESRKVNRNNTLSDSGTGMEFSTEGLEISELDSQEIRDRSLAEIDEMLATVPLEELTDFPIVALDNNASSAAQNTIPNQNCTTESEFIPLSEVKGESTCAEVKGGHSYAGGRDGSMSPVFDQESEDLRRAMQESLRTQVS